MACDHDWEIAKSFMRSRFTVSVNNDRRPACGTRCGPSWVFLSYFAPRWERGLSCAVSVCQNHSVGEGRCTPGSWHQAHARFVTSEFAICIFGPAMVGWWPDPEDLLQWYVSPNAVMMIWLGWRHVPCSRWVRVKSNNYMYQTCWMHSARLSLLVHSRSHKANRKHINNTNKEPSIK